MAMHVDTDDKTSTLIQVSGYNYQNGTFESLRDTLMLTVTTKRWVNETLPHQSKILLVVTSTLYSLMNNESGIYALVFLSLLCDPCCNYCTSIALAECIIMYEQKEGNE